MIGQTDGWVLLQWAKKPEEPGYNPDEDLWFPLIITEFDGAPQFWEGDNLIHDLDDFHAIVCVGWAYIEDALAPGGTGKIGRYSYGYGSYFA